MYQMPLTSSRPATLCCLAFVLACAVTPAFAQTGSATVQGAVTDPTGAVLPGADVTLTQVDTAVAQKTKTNAAGLYVFPVAPIGTYKITVTSAGMETWEGQIVLQAGLAAEVNVALRVGAASTQVTVGDVTPMVDTSTPTISERLDRVRIELFPVNDAMGLVGSTTPGFEGGGSGPCAYGLRNDSTELTVDFRPTHLPEPERPDPPSGPQYLRRGSAVRPLSAGAASHRLQQRRKWRSCLERHHQPGLQHLSRPQRSPLLDTLLFADALQRIPVQRFVGILPVLHWDVRQQRRGLCAPAVPE
jgi:hypothetical protein